MKSACSRPALIVTGSYLFKSLGAGREPTEVQLFVDKLDPREGAGGGSGTLAHFFRRIEDVTRHRVFDQSADCPAHIVYSNNLDLSDADSDPGNLSRLLANIERQTSLHFEQTSRDLDVYCVREEPPTPDSTHP